ncbi:MAG: hypothetical protein ABFS35_08850 [Bacteroidota bacterium]
MKKHTLLIAIMILIACKQSPNYNPFDNQFDISVKDFTNNRCDTISAGCGYFNLQITSGKLRPFYQIHYDNFNEVVAKGFTYYVDTNSLVGMNDIYDEYVLDSILNSFIDFKELSIELSRFNYIFSEQKGELIKIIKKDMTDTISLRLGIYPIEKDSIAVREISYWKGK